SLGNGTRMVRMTPTTTLAPLRPLSLTPIPWSPAPTPWPLAPAAMIRNRIKSHRRVRAGDLVPHEWNYRTHPQHQRAAPQPLYAQIGFARTLLAYELPDGRLKLINGHLRRDLDPDLEVDVEILDVTDEEARALLQGAALDDVASHLPRARTDATSVATQT